MVEGLRQNTASKRHHVPVSARYVVFSGRPVSSKDTQYILQVGSVSGRGVRADAEQMLVMNSTLWPYGRA
jgi:hypothetical protein